MRAAVGLADGERHLGHVGLDDGVEEPAAALDDAVLLLLHPRHEARGIHDEHQRQVVGVAEPDEPRGLVGGLVVDGAGHVHRLVGDHADGTPVDPRERGDHRRPALLGDLEHVAVVEHPQQDFHHVVGHVVRVRHDAVQLEVVRRDLGFQPRVDGRRIVKGVGGQELQVIADVLVGRRLGLHHLVDVAVPGLRVGAAEFVEADVLAGDVLDDVGAGDEHVALIAHGDHQVGLDRRVHGTAGALAEDQRDLGHQAAQQLVAPAQLGVPRQRRRGVLDAGAGRVVDADDRAADHGHPLHQPGHLATEHLADRTLEHRLVVGEHPDRAAVDGAVPGHHAVTEEGVGVPGGLGQRADLQEGARVQQRVDARAGARDALLVAAGPGLLVAGILGELELLPEFRELLGRRRRRRLRGRFCGHVACFLTCPAGPGSR